MEQLLIQSSIFTRVTRVKVQVFVHSPFFLQPRGIATQLVASTFLFPMASSLCHGSGYQPRDTPCPHCHGHGVPSVSSHQQIAPMEDFLDLTLQPGIRSSHQIYFRGLGHEQFQRRRGDVLVKLQVIHHPVFEVEDFTLHLNVTLTWEEALMGFQREVKLPDNEVIQLKKEGRTADRSASFGLSE